MKYQSYSLGDFALQKGGLLPDAQLEYLTLGRLNEARDNVVVCPSWFTASPADIQQWMVGPDRALNPDQWFIVLPTHFGAGVSSSPSTIAPPMDRGRFPRVTTYDNVVAQHRLLTEVLGIDKVRLVAGWSMGAQQTFAWGALYPDTVEAIAPINGSVRTSNYNRAFLLSLMRAIRNDPAFDDGFYGRPPVEGIRTMAAIYAGWGTSEPFFRKELYRGFGAHDVESFTELLWEQFFLKCDANDLLAQLKTWWYNDLGDHPNFNGDLDAALRSITARSVIIQSDTDRYFPPVDNYDAASRMPNARVELIETDWGHMAPFNPQDQRAIDKVLTELLT